MPPVLPFLPLIFGAIGAAGAGVEAAGAIKNLVGGGSKASPYPTTAQVAQNKNALSSLVQQGAGNVQEAGGGGLSPNYTAEVIGSQTGNLNQISQLQDLVKQYLGGSTTGGGGSGGDALQQLVSSAGGGSNTNFSQLAIPNQNNASLSGGPGLADNSVYSV